MISLKQKIFLLIFCFVILSLGLLISFPIIPGPFSLIASITMSDPITTSEPIATSDPIVVVMHVFIFIICSIAWVFIVVTLKSLKSKTSRFKTPKFKHLYRNGKKSHDIESQYQILPDDLY